VIYNIYKRKKHIGIIKIQGKFSTLDFLLDWLPDKLFIQKFEKHGKYDNIQCGPIYKVFLEQIHNTQLI
jgi:hypothetical protein